MDVDIRHDKYKYMSGESELRGVMRRRMHHRHHDQSRGCRQYDDKPVSQKLELRDLMKARTMLGEAVTM